MAKRIPFAFAATGETTTVPDTSTGTELSWESGWSPAYNIKRGDPGYRDIDRPQHNYLFNAITENIKEWQEQLAPEHSPEIDYPINMITRYLSDNYQKVSNIDGAVPDPSASDDWVVYNHDMTKNISSISEIGNVDKNVNLISISSYHDGMNVGGGFFIRSNGRHNGGTFIDPNRSFPDDWSDQGQLTAWFVDSGLDVDGWQRIDNFGGVTPYLWGTMANGITDDTIPIKKASLNSGLIVSAGNYILNDDLVLRNVSIMEGVKISGSGSVRGVILNDDIPHSSFKIPYNISLLKNRSNLDSEYDLIVDPCLGDDSNDGETHPVKTLLGLKNRLNALILLGNDTDITVVFRDGLIEIPESLDFETSQSTASVTFKSNNFEKPILTGPLKWYFRDGATAVNDGTIIHTLYSVDNDFKRCVLSNNIKWGGGLVRSTSADITESLNVCSLIVDNDIAAALNSSSNLDYARLHVTQSWTSSIYDGISITSNTVNYTKPSDQSSFYYNGFSVGVNSGYAPFFIEGLAAYKTDDTWFADDSFIHLPNFGINYIACLPLDNPITISAERYNININIAYHTPSYNSIKNDYTSTPKPGGAFIYATGDDFSFSGDVKYIEGTGVIGSGLNCNISIKNGYWIGHTGGYIGIDTAPETITGATIYDSNVQFWGTNNAGASAIQMHADGEIRDSIVSNGPTNGIRNNASSASVITVKGTRLLCYNLGMPHGNREERFCTNDSGGYYHNGISSQCNHIVSSAGVYNVCGFKNVFGYYIDNNGIGGTYDGLVYFNIFGGQGFYNRNATGLTANNNYLNIVGSGAFVAGDVSGGTLTKSVILGVKNLGIGVTVTGYMSEYTENKSIKNAIALKDKNEFIDNGGISVFTDQTLSHLFLEYGEGSDYWTEFDPELVGSITSGTATYSFKYGEYQKQGPLIRYRVTLKVSSHTGTGNVLIDLSDIGYPSKLRVGDLTPANLCTNVQASFAYISSDSQFVEFEPTISMPTGSFYISIEGAYPL